MSELTTVLIAGCIFAVFGAIGFGLLWFWLVLSRVNNTVIWEGDATIRGKVEVYHTHIKKREEWSYLLYNLRNGAIAGFVFGVVAAIFSYGLNEVLA